LGANWLESGDEGEATTAATKAQVTTIIDKIKEANTVHVVSTEEKPITNSLNLVGLGTLSNSAKMNIDGKDRQLSVILSYTNKTPTINDPTTFEIENTTENGINYVNLKFSNDATNYLTINCLESDMLPVIRYIMNEDTSSPIFATSDGKYLKSGGIAYITNDAASGTPKMPNLSFRYISGFGQIQMTLNIVYNQTFNTQSSTAYHTINDHYEETGKVAANTEWIPLCTSIIGGKAILSWDGIPNGTFTFNIRGINPTSAQITQYLNAIGLLPNSWYITDLLRDESSSKQFNYKSTVSFYDYTVGTPLLASYKGLKGLPIYGPPNGWGMGQLDNWKINNVTNYANSDQRWNWKSNLDGVKIVHDLKVSDINAYYVAKMIVVNNWNNANPKNKVQPAADQTEGTVTFSHVNSNIFPSIDFGTNDITKKSFMDATVIKSYNGGAYYYQLVRNIDPITKLDRTAPVWTIRNLSCATIKGVYRCDVDYVAGICQ
jgi:hypothetical protein